MAVPLMKATPEEVNDIFRKVTQGRVATNLPHEAKGQFCLSQLGRLAFDFEVALLRGLAIELEPTRGQQQATNPP